MTAILRFVRDYVVPDIRSKHFWISVVISIAFARYLDLGLQFVVIILGHILWHEIGHTVAILKLGYSARRIQMNLLYGLAGSNDPVMSRQDMFIISSMGPLFGFALSLLSGIGFLLIENAELAENLLLIALIGGIINGFNIIPVLPLDGGQMLKAVGYSIHPRLGFTFGLIGFFVGVGYLVYQVYTRDIFGTVWALVVLGLGFVMLWSHHQNYSEFKPITGWSRLAFLACYLGLAGMLGGLSYTIYRTPEKIGQTRAEFQLRLHPIQETPYLVATESETSDRATDRQFRKIKKEISRERQRERKHRERERERIREERTGTRYESQQSFGN